MECWCCGRGHEARRSKWACPSCEAHGARKHKLNAEELRQLNESWAGLWSPGAKMMNALEELAEQEG